MARTDPGRRLAGSGACLAVALVVSSVEIGTAQAQQLDTVVTVACGSGLSLGAGSGTVLKRRSPLQLEVDVGLVFDADQAMEWTPSLMMELESRVSIGVNPSLKRAVKIRKLHLYGGVGLPFFFAPFTLLGAQAAVGAWYPVYSRFSLVLELHGDVFFVGSDLPDGSVLAKLDLSLGIRFDL